MCVSWSLKKLRTLNKAVFTLLFFSLFSCTSTSLEDFRKKGDSLIKDLCEDLEKVHSKEDLEKMLPFVKKKMKKLTSCMIETAEYLEKHKDLQTEGESSSIYSDHLQYELVRICEIEGAKLAIENIQADMLDKLDMYLRKAQKRKIFESTYFQN